MASVKVTVKTQKRYSQIDSIVKMIRSNSDQACYDFARGTAAAARVNAHVITGYMKGSIRNERVGKGQHKVVVGASYAAYEEYGTRYRPPHPFLRPAVEANKARFQNQMRQIIHR